MSHEKAFDLHLKGLGLGIWEQTEKEQLLLSSAGQQPIAHSINAMNKKEFKQTKKKFVSAYFLAKTEAFFPKLISHKERHNVIVSTAYCNRTLGTLFLEYIAENLREGLKEKLNLRNFYSLLTGGSTDSAVNKKEVFFVLTFNPKPEGNNEVSVELNYFDLVEPKTANAEGIINTIQESFKGVKINYLNKLVGYGSDGVSVNRGAKEGIKTILQRDNKGLTFGWCVVQKLKLASKMHLRVLHSMTLNQLLLRLYYLYEKSPKKLRHLKQLSELYKESDFSVGA